MSITGSETETAPLDAAVGSGGDTSWLDEFAAKLTPDECEYLCNKLQEQRDAVGDVEDGMEDAKSAEEDVMIPLTDDEEL